MSNITEFARKRQIGEYIKLDFSFNSTLFVSKKMNLICSTSTALLPQRVSHKRRKEPKRVDQMRDDDIMM